MAILKKLRDRKRKTSKIMKDQEGNKVNQKVKLRKDGSVKKIVHKTKRGSGANNSRRVQKFDKKGDVKKDVTYFRGKRTVTKKDKEKNILGRKRTVLKDRTASGDKIKQVIVEKKNKDGTVSYKDKFKRRKKGELLKKKYSKVKGKGKYDSKTGHDISYSGTRKRFKGKKDNSKVS